MLGSRADTALSRHSLIASSVCCRLAASDSCRCWLARPLVTALDRRRSCCSASTSSSVGRPTWL